MIFILEKRQAFVVVFVNPQIEQTLKDTESILASQVIQPPQVLSKFFYKDYLKHVSST